MYQLMQLDPGLLWQKIRIAQGRETWRLLAALVLRDAALLAFAIVYIASFSILFGPSNSCVGVASFCMLLSARYVNYGYRIQDSLLALALILSSIGLMSAWLPHLPFGLAFVLNGLLLLVLLRLTASHPQFGNGGVYVFSYILVVYTKVAPAALPKRWGALLLALLLCGAVLWHQNHTKDRQITLHQILKWPGLTDQVFRWQLRLALGVASVLWLGQFLGNGRARWLGFAGMSLLLPVTTNLKDRGLRRLAGVIVGSIAFTIAMAIVPTRWAFLIAPVTGFGLGLTPSYFWASCLNCFGALAMATTFFGVVPASGLRILNNGLGLLLAGVIAWLCRLVWHYYQQHYLMPND